jgi:superfamily II DNA or RNA helicase
LVLVPTDEITGQWVEKLEFAAKGRYSVGVVKAERDEPGADLVVGSVATLVNPLRRNAIQRVGLVIVDEAHHSVAPSYLALLEHFDVMEGAGNTAPWADIHAVPCLGLSATLSRSDGQSLGHVWQDLVFSRGISWAQRKGYLLDIVPWTIKVPDITATASDEALDAMLADSIAPEVVVETWMAKAVGLCDECQAAVQSLPEDSGPALPSYCPNGTCGLQNPLPSTVLFAPLVKSAQAFADAFNRAGIKAEVIHGGLGKAERRNILDRYEAGVITVLCNAMVLKEGWDSPRTMCVIWARPTQSIPLFIQGVGRGLRPWLSAEAPPRELQRCVLLCVTDMSGVRIATVADLSENPLDEVVDGKSLQEMEEEYDLGRALDEVERAYRGPVRVEQWDALVAASSKAWKYTKEGVPFLPTAKRSAGYVFVAGSEVWAYMPHPTKRGKFGAKRLGRAPDVSLAMALAEDEAQELGGDIGRLLADKGRAWRKDVPSVPMVQAAQRAGVPQADIDRILGQRASGKAGKLSDLTDRMNASKVIDPIVIKLRERATA